MDQSNLYKIKTKFACNEIDNELILVPLTNNIAQMNAVFTLNETGKVIWENINESSSVENMANVLTQRYQIDENTAKNDILLFLEKINQLLNT